MKIPVNREELSRLLKRDEGPALEFKRSTAELREGMQTVCAFLNGAGGMVLFGARSDGMPEGQQVSDKTLREIAQAFERFEPPVNIDIRRVKVKDDREVLGLDEDFSPQEAQAAYLRLAKLYHPDRHFDGDMRDMKSALEKLFSRITEAYNVLSNKAQREHIAYLSNQGRAKSARKTATREDRTAMNTVEKTPFALGVEKYEAGDYLTALESFRKASKLDPRDSGCHYYQGLVLSQLPRKLYEAEECFKKAIKLAPSKTDYSLELGKLLIKRGLTSNAFAVLKEALTRAPDSEQIKEALMSIEDKQS